MARKSDRLTEHMTELEIALSHQRAENQRLQRELEARPVLHAEDLTAKLVHEDAIVFSPEAKTAVLAVAIRLEERADKRTLPNGAALCHVEELYERSGDLKALLGDITEHDENEAQALLQELIGSR